MNKQNIRTGIKSRLLNNTDAGGRVYETPIDPNFLDTLPTISIYTPTMVCEMLTNITDAQQRVIVTVEIDVVNAAITDWQTKIERAAKK